MKPVDNLSVGPGTFVTLRSRLAAASNRHYFTTGNAQFDALFRGGVIPSGSVIEVAARPIVDVSVFVAQLVAHNISHAHVDVVMLSCGSNFSVSGVVSALNETNATDVEHALSRLQVYDSENVSSILLHLLDLRKRADPSSSVLVIVDNVHTAISRASSVFDSSCSAQQQYMVQELRCAVRAACVDLFWTRNISCAIVLVNNATAGGQTPAAPVVCGGAAWAGTSDFTVLCDHRPSGDLTFTMMNS